MSYLSKYDTLVSVRCGTLTPAQQLRTGFKTMGQVKKAVALIHNPLNYSAFGKSSLNRTIDGDMFKILNGTASASGIRTVKLDKGTDQAIRPQAEDNEGDASSDWSGTYRTFDSPPMSVVAEEEAIGQNIQQQIALYERGVISARELEANVRQLRGDIREVMEVALEPDAEGNLIPYAEREEIVGRAQAYSSAVPAPEAPEIGRVEQDEGDIPPEYVPEYVPTTRRHMGFAVEDSAVSDNRGSGSGQTNPNAPSYAPSNYDRGSGRGAGRNDFDREFDTPP